MLRTILRKKNNIIVENPAYIKAFIVIGIVDKMGIASSSSKSLIIVYVAKIKKVYAIASSQYFLSSIMRIRLTISNIKYILLNCPII